MIKPEVRIIQNQEYSEPQEVNISSAEAYALMAKYGIPTTQPVQQPAPNVNPLTFEEMIAMEQNKIKAEKQQMEMERMREMNKPTPYSFDRSSVRHYDTQYKSIDDTGFGVEIKVVSNMDINKGYGY